MLINQLQQVRMLVIWPLVVGAGAFLALRLVLKLVSPINRISKGGVLVCVVSSVLAGVAAGGISRDWDNSLTYWLAFTVGLAFLAVVLLFTVTVHAVEDFNA